MHRTSRSFAIAVCAMLLAACTGGTGDGEGVSLTDPDLGSTRAVIYLSPQTDGLNDGDPGYVAFVRDDWSFDLLETSGMNEGMVLWTEDGVAFADKDADYRVGNSVTKIPSVKRDFQEGLFFDEETNQFISLYNDGFSERGYVEQLVEASPTAAKLSEVEGAYSILGQCEDGIYGVAPRSGDYLSEEEFESMRAGVSNTGQMLTRLYPLEQGKETLMAQTPSPDSAEPRGTAPCRNGVLTYPTFLSGEDGGSASGRAVVRRWDTRAGTVAELPLVDAQKHPMELSIDDVMGSVTLMRLDGEILWLLPGGRVMTVDATSGTASEEYRLELVGNSPYLHAQIAADTLWVLESPSAEGDDAVLDAFDLHSGKRRASNSIEGMADMLSVEMVLRSFAVSP